MINKVFVDKGASDGHTIVDNIRTPSLPSTCRKFIRGQDILGRSSIASSTSTTQAWLAY